jgi:RNA polymerase sigma factor FliA
VLLRELSMPSPANRRYGVSLEFGEAQPSDAPPPEENTGANAGDSVDPKLDISHTSEIVTAHVSFVLKLARVVAARMKRYVDPEDLAQSGIIGLIHAAEAYDPANPKGWKSYARIRVVGAMLDSLREQDPASRHLRTRQKRIAQARETLQFELGRVPSAEETAHALCMSLDALYSFAATAQSYQPPKTDIFYDAESEASIEDKHARLPDEICESQQLTERVRSSLEHLSNKEREIVSLYYFEDRTSAEIAEKLRRSEARVSQIHSAALKKLERILSTYKPPDANRRTLVRRRNRKKSDAKGSPTLVEHTVTQGTSSSAPDL